MAFCQRQFLLLSGCDFFSYRVFIIYECNYNDNYMIKKRFSCRISFVWQKDELYQF